MSRNVKFRDLVRYSGTLGYAVFTAPIKLVNLDPKDIPPGEKERIWPPTTATLIYGENDAVLVDALMTIDEGRNLADWVVASGKNLTTIYITHGHGDHFLGAEGVIKRFPKARLLATKSVIALMSKQIAPEFRANYWDKKFPNQITKTPVIADELTGDRFQLEGHDLIVVETGRTDTGSTTILHIPKLGLVVAGDVVYNEVHLHLSDSATIDARLEWISALDKVEGLNPGLVIAGHKWIGNEDNPRNIEETREYIRDFNRLADKTKTAREFYDKMIRLYPHRINTGALWDSVRAVKGNPLEMTKSTLFGYAVFTGNNKPYITSDPRAIGPDGKQRFWSPTSATLIYGERDAILVDPLMTIAEGHTLADWITASGKNLTTIYITHAHGDHYFGAGPVLERFPNARMVATASVVELMHKETGPMRMNDFWEKRFPDQITQTPVIAEELVGDSLQLEGHDLLVIETGHTDSDKTTVLYVPDLSLIVAGDVVYNDVHLFLAKSTDHKSREDWITALDKIETLNPRIVIAGHKWPGNEDNPRNIEETRKYIKDFDRLVKTTGTATELYNKMLILYPHRINPGMLWESAQAVKG
ncbi:MAG: MBL fold metallo-hydrolase [Hyperionvirus sp.]|uniref:MBL fold metallo-hydrolase n=1 Tax=Hyperionvirus sp. TaxID=2487770 RepID=A0A3G5AD66_9VIRU|nr:MAG: MBL fold metallo-hydrolase [Hyperionvirus sp.]